MVGSGYSAISGVLITWIMVHVGQGPAVLAADAGWGWLDCLVSSFLSVSFSLSLGDDSM